MSFWLRFWEIWLRVFEPETINRVKLIERELGK